MASRKPAERRRRAETPAPSAIGDRILDTNVLIVATGQDSKGRDLTPKVPADVKAIVRDWLAEFGRDASRSLVCDDELLIWKEYKNKLTEQDGPLRLVRDLLFQFHRVRYVLREAIPDALAPQLVSLRNDRKFVQVALADAGRSSIVNVCDTDWGRVEVPLAAHGVRVEHLAPEWYAKFCAEKQTKKRRVSRG